MINNSFCTMLMVAHEQALRMARMKERKGEEERACTALNLRIGVSTFGSKILIG